MVARLFNTLYEHYLVLRKPIQYAKRIGVNIGVNNRLTSCRRGMFGGEPYLVKIGNNCLFSGQVQFLTHDGSLDIFREEIPNAFIYKPITIGDNVFLGFRVIIMPGVNIGDNVAIGAGAVVTKDIPSNSIAVGVPARVVSSYDEYKAKIIPQADLIDGMNKNEKKNYLFKKFKIPSK